MDVGEALSRRRSCRSFLSRPIPDPVLEEVLSAFLRAPSAGNTWGQELLVLTGADVERYWAVTLPEVDRRTAFPWPGLLCAPVLVIPLVDPSAYLRRYGATDKAHAGLGDSLDAWPVPYWWVDVGASIMAVLVAAAAAELGSLLFGMFTHTASVLAEFGVPEDYQAAGVIALGYPSSDGNRASLSLKVPRPNLEMVLHHGQW